MNEIAAPEEIELQKKSRLLGRLQDRLADREEELAELNAEIEKFEARYQMEVGRLYAAFDDIEAQIAEEEVKLVPDDQDIRKRAEELRRRAEESAARANDENLEKVSVRSKPTAEAKKAYHELARVIHPDLALDNAEKERRHNLMTMLNAAYSSGDQAALDKLVDDFRDSPDLVVGDSPGDDLVRMIRRIAQVKRRMEEIAVEKERTRQTEVYGLWQEYLTEQKAGRDMLRVLGERTKTHIKKSERRLENLRNVNRSAEEYVRDKFGMDIADFR